MQHRRATRRGDPLNGVFCCGLVLACAAIGIMVLVLVSWRSAAGACCLPNDTCRNALRVDCETDGGTFLGLNSTCMSANVTCPAV